jgi:nuclear pore complex protein Nup133
MFSPEASIQSARSSLRGTRRRQRDSSGHDQQPRRKRNKTTDDGALHTTATAHTNGNANATMNGHAGHSSVENSLVLVDMPVREKKTPQKRAALKEDSAQYLVCGIKFAAAAHH